MYLPNNNFNVPFTRQLEGALHPGKIIALYGHIPHGANRFSVNLQCGDAPFPIADVALHLSVRFPENVVVRNTHQGGWQNEERDGGMPLFAGQHFQVLILVEHSSFKIAFNGNHFAEYYHRIPFERITHINVEGDVQINNVTGIQGAYGSGAHEVFNPLIPHVEPLHGGMFVGRLVRVRGTVPHDVYRFALNLMNGPSTSHDIGLHVSVRPTEGFVEINTQRGGGWEEGQQIRPCPLRPGDAFELLVLCDSYNFKIAFNGHHFAEFPHRLPYQSLTHLCVEGSVHVTSVRLEGQPRGDISFTPLPPPETLPFFPSPYPQPDQHHHLFPNPYPILY